MRAVVARNLEGRGINLHPRTNLTEVLSFIRIWCQYATSCFCLKLIFFMNSVIFAFFSLYVLLFYVIMLFMVNRIVNTVD